MVSRTASANWKASPPENERQIDREKEKDRYFSRERETAALSTWRTLLSRYLFSSFLFRLASSLGSCCRRLAAAVFPGNEKSEK